MNAGFNPEPKPSNKPVIYSVIGVIFLFIMAITWSLDDSFVYTSFGAAVFFFFLAYYNRTPRTTKYQKSAGQYSQSRPDFFSQIFDALKDKSAQRQPRPRPIHSQVDNSKRFALAVMFFIGTVFVIIFLSVLFAGDPSEDDSSESFYTKAEKARYAGQYDSAEYYYRQVLAENPEDLGALNGIGILSLNQKRYDQALRQFDDALTVDPDYKYARYNKALTFYYQHNYRRSLKESFNLLERTPEYFDAMQLAGDNYYDQQNYDSAKYWYDQGYNSGLRSAWLCHVLGYLYDRKNETPRAVELYKEAIGYDSSKVDVYIRLGELYPGNEGDFYRAKAAKLKSSN
jgi:tetratricopeptide (TPR) repeat protein